jgi:hypothetical protein
LRFAGKRDFYSHPKNAVGVRGSKKSGSNAPPQKRQKARFCRKNVTPTFPHVLLPLSHYSHVPPPPFKGVGVRGSSAGCGYRTEGDTDRAYRTKGAYISRGPEYSAAFRGGAYSAGAWPLDPGTKNPDPIGGQIARAFRGAFSSTVRSKRAFVEGVIARPQKNNRGDAFEDTTREFRGRAGRAL